MYGLVSVRRNFGHCFEPTPAEPARIESPRLSYFGEQGILSNAVLSGIPEVVPLTRSVFVAILSSVLITLSQPHSMYAGKLLSRLEHSVICLLGGDGRHARCLNRGLNRTVVCLVFGLKYGEDTVLLWLFFGSALHIVHRY